MATRFFMHPAASNPPAPVSVAFDSAWEQTGQARTGLLALKTKNPLSISNNPSITVPITTTQDLLGKQFVSDPMRAKTIGGTVSFVMRFSENDVGCNCALAIVIRVVSQDGSIVRGDLYRVFGTDTEFALSTSETRIVNAQAVTPLTILDGDRIVVEVGATATAPSASGTFQYVCTTSASTDYALTSGLTTAINSWLEFSDDLFPSMPNNQQAVSSGDGMSVSEKIR